MSEMKRLDELCTIELSSIDKKSKTNEKPVKLCNFVDVYNNWNIYPNMTDSFMYATASDKNIDIFSLKKNDVLITKDSETRDDIGMSACVYDDLDNTVLGYHCALIRPKDNLVGSYLNAFLSSPLGRKHFSNQASGSGQRYTLTKDAIGTIKVPIISINKQKEIGKFFSNLDQKIAENKKICSELESMAKLLYDYWFVQFDFPDENGKPYKSSGGKMVWNEELKREIPEGWTVHNIEDYCKIFTGKKDVNQSLNSGQYRFYSCAPGYRYSDEKLYDGEAVLISGNGSYTGRTIYVNCAFDLYQRTYACVSNGIADNLHFIYFSLLRYLVPYVQGGTHGSAIPYIVYDDIAKAKIIINDKLVSKFENIIKPIINKIVKVENENQDLSSLRDYILPMLMNGQVKIK